MMAERFSLDTDILVFAADSKAWAKHARAVALLHGAAAADCVLTVQVLAEFFHAVTHSGVTLAPIVGRLTAQEVLSGSRAELFAPYRPERFSGGLPDTSSGGAALQVPPANL